MLYVRESHILSKTQITKLETFYRYLLRQLQSLPEHVAKGCIYLLYCMLPIEAIIHRRMLNMLQTVASDPDSILYEIDLC